MAITYDSSGSGNNVGDTISYAVTVGNNANRLLVVGVGSEHNVLVETIPPSSITYDGVAMTLIDFYQYRPGSSPFAVVSLWYLLAPNVGVGNVVVTFGAAPSTGGSSGAVSVYNVHQQAYDVKAKATGTSNSPTVAITTLAAGAMLFDAVHIGSSTMEFTAGADQTERYEVGAGHELAGSTELCGAAGPKTMSWSFFSAKLWGIVTASFIEYVAWAPVTNTFTAHVINSFDASGIDTDIFGLTFDGRNLWVGGNANQAIYEVDRLGNIIKSIDTSGVGDAFTGLVYIDGSLWAINYTDSYLIHFSLTGVVIQTIDLSGFQGTLYGLDFDGKYFWLADVASQAIYQLDTNGVLIKTLTTTYTDSKGVCFFRKNLLVSDETKRCLEIYDRLGNVIGVFDFDPIDSAPRAITFDGVYFWIAGNENDYIYQISIG